MVILGLFILSLALVKKGKECLTFSKVCSLFYISLLHFMGFLLAGPKVLLFAISNAW